MERLVALKARILHLIEATQWQFGLEQAEREKAHDTEQGPQSRHVLPQTTW
jgi:hypothetical protein